jgi:WD40 repeat protein
MQALGLPQPPPSRHGSSEAGGNKGGNRLLELEALLVDKISGRGSTLPKALTKVVKQFDSDGSGELSYDELSRALRCFLPGIDQEEVLALAKGYDADGGGTISVDELTRRMAKVELMTKGSQPLPLPAAARGAREAAARSVRSESVISKVLPPRADSLSFDERIRQYATFLRRRLGRMGTKSRPADRLAHHLSDMELRRGREALRGALASAPGAASGSRLNQADFRNALRSLREPGCPDLSDADIALLWESCDGGDPKIFTDIVFGPRSKSTSGRGSKVGSADEGEIRLRYRKCKTVVSPPSTLDVQAALTRSSRLPNAFLTLDHVHGFGTGTEAGPNLFCSEGRLFYSIAAVVVAAEVDTGRQSHLTCHSDDISALCLSGDGQWGASGQVGRRPSVMVWSTARCGASWDRLYEVGAGFFERAVSAIALNSDGSLLAAVGCDDRHSLGVWDLSSSRRGPQLIAQAPAQNGPPRQVSELAWAPGLLSGRSSAQNGHRTLSEALVSVGKSRHIKVWGLDRAAGTLRSQSSNVFGNKTPLPKRINCVAWIPSSAALEEAFVVGGDNGVLYVFKEGKCIQHVEHGSGCSISRLAFLSSSGGSRCVLLSSGSDGRVKHWIMDSNLCLRPESLVEVPTGADQLRGENAQKRQSESLTAHPEARVPGSSLFPEKPKEQSGSRRSLAASTTKKPGSMKADLAVHCSKSSLSSRSVYVGTSRGEMWAFENGSSAPRQLGTGHAGAVAGLATHRTRTSRYATAGEDGFLILWDAKTMGRGHREISRIRLDAPGRSVSFSPDGRLLAVGMKRGAAAVYAVEDEGGRLRKLRAFRRCREDLDDLKFSPDGSALAIASHDNFIDIYDITLERRGEDGGGIAMRHRARCRGHSSYVTHIDWSMDGALLQSNCGAYEVLYWDAKTGKQLRSTRDNIESNALWDEWTCVLGFPVMGIWDRCSDGTDVNALHRSSDGRFVVTADDKGSVNLFNCPCIAAEAPRRQYQGHSSHVSNIRFTAGDSWVLSCGGGDRAIFCWRVHRRPPPASTSSSSAEADEQQGRPHHNQRPATKDVAPHLIRPAWA